MVLRFTRAVLLLSSSAFAQEWESTIAAKKVSPLDFKVPEGLEVTVWASTPDLYNPTNFDVDGYGRIWVAEGVNYRDQAGRRPAGDRIVVLQDSDGDGRADQSHTFVQEKGLVAPLGVAVFDNKVVVSQPPDLIVYTDVDRNLKFDPKVDKREVLLTGFNAKNHDHSLHSVTGGPDGKWYFNNGNCGAIFTDKSGKKIIAYGDYHGGGGEYFVASHLAINQPSDDGFRWTAGMTVRIDPDGKNAEVVGHGYRNSYEQTINSHGEVFQNDNDDPPACRNSYVLEYGSAGYFTRDGRSYRTVMRPGVDFAINHWRQKDPGTFDVGDIYGGGSPAGVAFYENGALGAEHAGTYLSCEPGRNVIFGYQPEVRGAGYLMKRGEFLNSNADGKFVGGDFAGGDSELKEDQQKVNPKLFRPSDVVVGSDGAIYVADWFDPRVGGHGTMDDSYSGTIYRIAPKGFKPKLPKFDLSTVEGAALVLRNPSPNVRWAGFQALKSFGDKSLSAAEEILNDPNPWIAARAIWLLPYLGKDGEARCRELLNSQDERTRLVALRALRRAGKDIYSAAQKLATDESAAIRRDAALSMRGMPAEKAIPVLVEVARRWDGKDKNYLESIGLGAENNEPKIWSAMHAEFGDKDPLKWSEMFAKLTWRLWPSNAVEALKQRAHSNALTDEQRLFAVDSLAFIEHQDAAQAMLTLAVEGLPTNDMARHWLISRRSGSWSEFGLSEQLKKTGIYDPDSIVVTPVVAPKPTEAAKYSVEDVLKLKGDKMRGQATVMRCIMCHEINGAGVNYGPDLKGWVSRQGVSSAYQAIINPAADIAHGFEGVHVYLKNGQQVDGVVIARADPVIVKSIGGLKQMIPLNRIHKRRSMKHSLMLSADQLSLSAQDVADIVEWLKGY